MSALSDGMVQRRLRRASILARLDGEARADAEVEGAAAVEGDNGSCA